MFTGAVLLPLLLSGCLMNEETEEANALAPVPGANTPPTISGSPPRVVKVGVNYSFVPNSSDADGNDLSFFIDNKPGWLEFDTSNGALTGVPFLGSEGNYTDIVITVDDGIDMTSLAAFSITVESESASNLPPEISGTPATAAVVGTAYSFMPSASDPDGDSLAFNIEGNPAWLTIDALTGIVSGAPQITDVGIYPNIVVSVNDSQLSSSLPAFTIEVTEQAVMGSVTLSWTAPTQNTDGSSLDDLDGYRIYYGTSQGSYPNEIIIDNPGLTTYVVDNLVAGTYYFVSTAVNRQMIESDYSNVAIKTVTP